METKILQSLLKEKNISDRHLQVLVECALKREKQAQAFGLNQENALRIIQQRTEVFLQIYSQVIKLCEDLNFDRPEDYLCSIIWNFWLPLAIKIKEKQEYCKNNHRRAFILGILGGQGMGKTTLTKVLQSILNNFSLKTAIISLDDLYKTHAERQKIRQENPLLIKRGPPGTHDIQLGLNILNDLAKPIKIPRFNKSLRDGDGDRTEPELIYPVDVILFEGWFVGAQPLDVLKNENQLAIESNKKLKEYLPLWEQLDFLLILYPLDYRWSLDWRKQAEQKMKAEGKAGMSDEEIEKFVQYFWNSLHPELFITPLTTNGNLVDLVVEIKRDRTIGNIYKP